MASREPPEVMAMVDSLTPKLDGTMSQTLERMITTQLPTMAKEEQLEQVLTILRQANTYEEEALQLTSIAFRYLKRQELWRVKFDSLASLQAFFDPDGEWDKASSRNDVIQTRKQRASKSIENAWGPGALERIPSGLQPNWYSDNLLRGLVRLSKRMGMDDALPLLQAEVDGRLTTPGRRKHSHLVVMDVERVLAQVLLTKKITAGPPTTEGSDDAAGRGSARLRTVSESGSELSALGRTPSPPSSPLRRSSQPPQASTTPSTPRRSSRIREVTTPYTPPPRTAAQQGEVEEWDSPPEAPETAEGAAPETTETETAETAETAAAEAPESAEAGTTCGCFTPLGDEAGWPASETHDPLEWGSWALDRMGEERLMAMCHAHLRRMMKGLGMKNNYKRGILTIRLLVAHENRDDLLGLSLENPEWYHRALRPAVTNDLTMLYRFLPVRQPRGPPGFKPMTVLSRLVGSDAYSMWEASGNLLIPDFFAHLNEPRIVAAMHAEFELHRHHERETPTVQRQGWSRGMYHTLGQQNLRMDPGFYALVVSLREDHQWRLITYPYLAKDAKVGENTGFLHLDIDVEKYMRDGTGSGLLSTAVSLCDETEGSCATVVTGFHKQIEHWARRVRARGQSTKGSGSCDKIYIALDRERFGEPRPMPCPAFGVRVTHPAVIHGSTPVATDPRRVMYNWYVGVDGEHEQLELPGLPSWSEVAGYHRDGLIPKVQPNGRPLRHTVPKQAFPATVSLRGVSPLCDALVGARRWSDPAVIRERDVLLGPDDEKALELTREIRERLMEAHLREMEVLMEVEAQAFGANAFFKPGDGEAQGPMLIDSDEGGEDDGGEDDGGEDDGGEDEGEGDEGEEHEGPGNGQGGADEGEELERRGGGQGEGVDQGEDGGNEDVVMEGV